MRCLAAGLAYLACLAIPLSADDELDPSTISRKVILTGGKHEHVTAESLDRSAFSFESPDAWLFIDGIVPSKVIDGFLNHMWVANEPAFLNANIRVQAFENGTVVIPHGPDFTAMTVFNAKGLSGASMPLTCRIPYDDDRLGSMKSAIRSFRLKRGYMATIAREEDGSGVSRNYVAQDQDLEVRTLPAGLDQSVGFIRIYPWRWTSKKGIAGGIWQDLNVGWYYDWNAGSSSTPDLEYVPIKQKRHWPGLNQDWTARGATHLLGYNEPDHKDQANLSVNDAIAGWPELMRTGLRLGSPAVSDGGLGWLYQFMEKADAAKLRVDFVAVHYYRAVGNPGDGRAAASQMFDFLKAIHDRTKRPIWVTEWNNGANWTGGKDPDEKDQKRAIEEMIKMLDKTPFVERYALYNWVEDCRAVKRKDDSLTPAGEVYRDKVSPLAYKQEKP